MRSAVRLRRSCFAVDQPTDHTTKWLEDNNDCWWTTTGAALPAPADTVDYWLTQERLWAVDAVCCPEPETAADEPDSEQLQKAFPKIGIAFRHQGDPGH